MVASRTAIAVATQETATAATAVMTMKDTKELGACTASARRPRGREFASSTMQTESLRWNSAQNRVGHANSQYKFACTIYAVVVRMNSAVLSNLSCFIHLVSCICICNPFSQWIPYCLPRFSAFLFVITE